MMSLLNYVLQAISDPLIQKSLIRISIIVITLTGLAPSYDCYDG